jgi:hypothetical protein
MGLFGVQLTHFVVGVCEHIISLLLNNTDSFTTHFLYLHRDKYAAPNLTHKTRENPCLIYLSKIHFLFFFSPLKILLPLLSFLSSPLFLPNEKTTHLGSNWKAKLIKSSTTTTKVAVLVAAPHSSSSSILHHHHHHLFFDLKLLSSPSPSPLGFTCLKTSLLSLSLPDFLLLKKKS